MATLKELLEKRATLATEIQKKRDLLTGEKTDFTPEERAQWEKVNKDYDALTGQIQIAQRAEKVAEEQRQAQPPGGGGGDTPGREDRDQRPGGGDEDDERAGAPSEEDRSLAVQAWLRRQTGRPLSKRHKLACRKARLHPAARELQIDLLPSADFRKFQLAKRDVHPSRLERALSAVSLSAGAATIAPETLIRQLEVAMLAFGGVLNVAETIRTATGERMSWPTANDTGNKGRQVGEGVAPAQNVDPTFGKVFWDAYKFTSEEILVPSELLEDSAFDLPSKLGEMLGERLGRILAEKFTIGTGAATPKGIVVASTAGPTTASATAISADEVLDLVHSVNPAYRIGAGFLFHDNILLHLRKLKTGDGQYLWVSGMSQGETDRLWGYPYQISMEMASTVEASAKTMLFGQLSKYKVRQVRDIRMYRLVERHRENDEDAFLAFIRADGNLLDAGVAPVKHLLQHA